MPFEDVKKIAVKLQSKKVAGSDGISAEHIKHGDPDPY